MRNLAIAMALASTVLATPALARDDAWYVGVGGGVTIAENETIDVGTTNNAGIAKLKRGYDVDGVVGHDFGGFRLEAETAYKKSGLTNYSSTVTTAARAVANGPLTNVPAGNFPYAGGSASALSFMLNGLLDFGEDDGLQGFVGGGAGVARIKNNFALNTLGLPFLNDSDTGFAWQALAGIRAPLSGNWDAGIKYRLFNSSNVDLVDANGRANSTKFRSHSLLGTLTYNFGGAPVAAPVVATPAVVEAPTPAVVETPVVQPDPTPVVQARECNRGPYIVFFDWDKADITPEAAGTLDSAATAYADCGSAQVMLAGHADKSGAPAYNVRLSERRNANVRGYLAGKGISEGVMSTQAFGESAPRVETSDGVRELQNRRVEVSYGPGSGN